MKKTFKIIGWICLGIFIQFKFNALYGIVFLENLNFHDRSYIVKIKSIPTKGTISILNIDTIVHHSLGPDYFVNVYIPEQYKVLNQKAYTAAESITGYKAYQMEMKRKYRDVLDHADFIIDTDIPSKNIPALPILVLFENMDQILHRDQTYIISTRDNKTQIEGPPEIEIKYPQKWGM